MENIKEAYEKRLKEEKWALRWEFVKGMAYAFLFATLLLFALTALIITVFPYLAHKTNLYDNVSNCTECVLCERHADESEVSK
jgi:hypothetical protein